MSAFTLQCVSKGLTISEKDFFESIAKEIQQSERNIPLKGKRRYKLEVSKRAQDYVLRLIDIKAEKEIEVLRLRSNQALMDLQAQLLADLTKTIERYTMQAALDIQQDFKDAQKLARKIDPEDEEFSEQYLKDLRDVSLSNLKEVAKKRSLED